MDNKAKIYLIPSTIAPGSQEAVISPQIRQVVSRVDYYLVENIRTARRFISSLKIRSVSDLNFRTYDKNTSEADLRQLLVPLLQGNDTGVISEAGCPAIADPGAGIVRWAHRNNVKVAPLAGPSSILLALMGSGMNGQHFEFHGYLPIDKGERARKIKSLEKTSIQTGKSQIFMEAPYRNMAMAQSLVDHCQSGTWVCFATDLCGVDESIITKTADQWKGKLPDLHKRPTIFILQANPN